MIDNIAHTTDEDIVVRSKYLVIRETLCSESMELRNGNGSRAGN